DALPISAPPAAATAGGAVFDDQTSCALVGRLKKPKVSSVSLACSWAVNRTVAPRSVSNHASPPYWPIQVPSGRLSSQRWHAASARAAGTVPHTLKPRSSRTTMLTDTPYCVTLSLPDTTVPRTTE